MAEVQTVIVGAGVIGLAIARALAADGHEVIALERNEAIGSETSARNSEVIHAGIYYPQGSLKAKLCVKGKELLYEYCASRGIAHERLGKLIVATDASQVPILHNLQDAARRNGVLDLERFSKSEVARAERELECVAALLSPSTGIVDSHGFMLSLQGEMEAGGGVLAVNSTLTQIGLLPNAEFLLTVLDGSGVEAKLTARNLVLSAGLQTSRLSRTLFSDGGYAPPETFMAKGNYFSLSGKSPFSRLIYPVPEPGGLGVHLTLDLNRRARFGPDVEWVDDEIYDVDPERGDVFYDAIRRYWPGLPDGALSADYSGIRPKIAPCGAPPPDFAIHGATDHGVKNLVCLYGIESPGLTASLAIADMVRDVLQGEP